MQNRRNLLASTFAVAISGRTLRLTRAQESTPAPTSSLGWDDAFDSDNGLFNIATTVAPISSIVRNVVGDRANIHGIVPDGTNSHTFEPAPSDAVVLALADQVFVNGLQLEDPTIELANANLKDGAEMLELGPLTITPEDYVYDFSFPEEDGKPNPHLWMNPMFALAYAKHVTAKMSERQPESAEYFAGNLARYEALLNDLDVAIAAAIQTIPEQNRKLLTYHDSYAYFAPRYGMTVIGAVQPSDFSEPSAKDVADLIDQIKEAQVPAVFGSEVFPSAVLEQIAKEAGAEYIDKLRDDEPPGEPHAPEHTYVGMMLNNMNLMVPALGGTAEALANLHGWDTWQ